MTRVRRFTALSAWGVLAWAGTALPANAFQSSFSARIRRADVPLQRVHLAPAPGGGWAVTTTGRPSGLPGGADVLYCNTTGDDPIPYVALAPGEALVDDGGIPSPTSPNHALFKPGCATQYAITGLEIAYCTERTSIGVQLDFYDLFDVCVGPVGPPHTVMLTGLPGSPTAGTLACFVVGIDLRGSGQEFTLLADGDGDFDPPQNQQLNDFGWRFRVLDPIVDDSGPLLGGNNFSRGGTRWSAPVVDYAADADGWNNNEWIFVEGVPWPSCWHVGSYTGTWLRLFGDACGTLVGAPLCTGDGGVVTCPCSNHSPSPNREGCANSVNGVNGGRLEGTGSASISTDTLSLLALRLPATTSALFFQGTVQTGEGTPFGDGLRCVAGTVVRLGTKTASQGQARYPETGDQPISVKGGVTAPVTRYYQSWYRNSAEYCTPASFNVTNGWRIDWQP